MQNLREVHYPHSYEASFDEEDVGIFKGMWAVKAIVSAMQSLGRETVARAQANDDIFYDCRLDPEAQDGLAYRRNEYVGL